ncbi:hypothetical protein TWF481_005483 [Arthrobotrys musiformis]|uniref:RGS domain-containing protein n=1 Tax=Arthrobotrys musiformis TaxID=47236 RepID=A0AAV9WFB5_9PEZI
MPDTTVLPFPSGSCDSPSAAGGSSLATLPPPTDISLISNRNIIITKNNSNIRASGGIRIVDNSETGSNYNYSNSTGANIRRNSLPIITTSSSGGNNSAGGSTIPNPSNQNPTSPSSGTGTALSPSSFKSTPTESFPTSPITPIQESQEPSDCTILPTSGVIINSPRSSSLASSPSNNSNNHNYSTGKNNGFSKKDDHRPVPVAQVVPATAASTSYYSTLAQRQIKNLSNAVPSPSFTTIEGPCSVKQTDGSTNSSTKESASVGNTGHTNRASISISSVNPLLSLANLARAVSGSPTNPQNGSTTPLTSQTLGRKKTLSSRRKSDGSLLKSSSYDNLESLNQRFPAGLTLAEVLETTGNHSRAVATDPSRTNTPNMHQSSSRLLRMTQDDRPFTRDFKDLFSTLMVSLPLTPHRLRFKTYSFTFTSDQAVNNLGSLKFSQSNRMPDPKDPSRIVTTTTTTTFSMAKEMARTVCQKFVAARFMEAVGEKTGTPFTSKNMLWQLTPKGIHVLERFCQRNGINSPHIMALLSSPLNTMRLVILERDAVTDKVSQDKSTTEIIFRRFAGSTPNIKQTVTASDSDSLSEYGDGNTGIKLAETRKVYDKVVKYSFTGKSGVDWLLDCCTTIEPVETHEIAGLFARFGLIQCVVEDKIYLQQEPKAKDFQPTKSAIYVITERGKRVAGWIDSERGSIEKRNGHANGDKSSQGSKSARGREAGENRETNTTRLSCIIHDPALRLLFREFLRETLCEENLTFWIDVNDFQLQFKNQTTLDNIRETLAYAYGIYNAFLAPGSPCELNIDHTLRQELASTMTRAVAKDQQGMLGSLREVATLFEKAQEQVFKLMASDSVPKFARTARYIEMSGDHGSDDGSANGITPPPRAMQRHAKIEPRKL